jgi:hypothetical protein
MGSFNWDAICGVCAWRQPDMMKELSTHISASTGAVTGLFSALMSCCAMLMSC